MNGKTKQIDTKRSLRKTQKQDKNEAQSFDQCYTPSYALDPLLPYLKPNWLIWESACGAYHLVNSLVSKGWQVVATDITMGHNFFKYQPDTWDIQLTNCPYSIKLDWLHRSYELNKPFALLLPVELLGVGEAQGLFEKHGIEVILINKRIDFQTVNTSFDKSTSWFPTAWFTWGLSVGQQLTYGKVTKRPDEQIEMWPVFAQRDSRQGRLF